MDANEISTGASKHLLKRATRIPCSIIDTKVRQGSRSSAALTNLSVCLFTPEDSKKNCFNSWADISATEELAGTFHIYSDNCSTRTYKDEIKSTKGFGPQSYLLGDWFPVSEASLCLTAKEQTEKFLYFIGKVTKNKKTTFCF